MTDQTLLAKARKARFDDLPNFSGHPSEDVERFLKSIKNITKANDASQNREILEIVRGKLTKSAGLWFDNNEFAFEKWSDFETAFRNRYFPATIISKKFDTLKQRKQLHDESIVSYYDDVINLCREIDPNMSEQYIIQHLMSGLNPKLKKELFRRESSINTLNEFLKYAKLEQDLHDVYEKDWQSLSESKQVYSSPDHTSIPSLTATIKPSRQYYHQQRQINHYPNSNLTQSSAFKRNSTVQRTNRTPTADKQTWNNTQQLSFKKQVNNQPTNQNQFNKCKVCGRTNHRTIDCYHKRTIGCYNCGQNHNVRDCTMPPNFQ
jgi:hypothetical protein